MFCLGFDFDNTLVSYDRLFCQVAEEKELIAPNQCRTKIELRNYLRQMGQEEQWTELQGEVYGPYLHRAPAFSGALETLQILRELGHILVLVSHKTRYPYRGQQHDLHGYAQEWLQEHRAPFHHVYFELTFEQKLQRIGQQGCQYYLDDLPEVLDSLQFPQSSVPVLFDPNGEHPQTTCSRIQHWEQLAGVLASCH